MIYHSLVTQQTLMRPWAMASYTFGARSSDMCHGPGCVCGRELDVPHAMDPAYVGAEVAREVVEAVYKAYPGQFFTIGKVELIKEVLLPDHFKVGFRPADVARQMTITWKLSRSVKPVGKRGRRPAAKDFAPLLQVRNKRGFKLRIAFLQRHVRFYPVERALGIVKKVCEQFVKEGAVVDVVLVYDGSGEEWPMTKALGQPAAVWKKELATALDEVYSPFPLSPNSLD